MQRRLIFARTTLTHVLVPSMVTTVFFSGDKDIVAEDKPGAVAGIVGDNRLAEDNLAADRVVADNWVVDIPRVAGNFAADKPAVDNRPAEAVAVE